MIDYQTLFHVGVRVPDLDAAMDELGDEPRRHVGGGRENPAQTLWTPEHGLQEIHLKYTYSAEGPQHIELLEGPTGIVLGRDTDRPAPITSGCGPTTSTAETDRLHRRWMDARRRPARSR